VADGEVLIVDVPVVLTVVEPVDVTVVSSQLINVPSTALAIMFSKRSAVSLHVSILSTKTDMLV
jgi:hypothetical protein